MLHKATVDIIDGSGEEQISSITPAIAGKAGKRMEKTMKATAGKAGKPIAGKAEKERKAKIKQAKKFFLDVTGSIITNIEGATGTLEEALTEAIEKYNGNDENFINAIKSEKKKYVDAIFDNQNGINSLLNAIEKKDRTDDIPKRTTDTLTVDQVLMNDEFIQSENKKYKAVMQGDGNFVWKGPGEHLVRWHAGTNNIVGVLPYRLVLHGDNNLVIYDKTSKVIWQTHTDKKGISPARLAAQDDGNLVLYDANKNVLWCTKWLT